MSGVFSLLAGLLLALGLLLCLARGIDGWQALRDGAAGGLKLMAQLFPTLVLLFPAVSLLRASGLPEALQWLLAPLLRRLQIPAETALLLLLRPLSGSAAMAEGLRLMRESGADSLLGRTAAVMLGSSETTFYVAAVYLGAAGVKNSRWAIPAALCADLACFVSAAWLCRALWG